MSTLRQVDMLVAGLGPAGGSAAARAALSGLNVLGVEKNRRIGEPVQCAEFIPLPMGRYAQADGVRVQAIAAMRSTLPSGTVTVTDYPGLMIDRARFDQAIARRAEEAGATLLTRSRLIDLNVEHRTALVSTPDGAVAVRYELLVAADGPASTVAARMGLPALDMVHTRQYTVPLRAPRRETDIWLSDEFPGGYGWLFPKGNVANLGVGADRRFADDLKGPLERLHQQLVREGIVAEEILARTGGPIPVSGMRDRLVDGRMLFVGDAAGLTHPITGAGIAAAVISGERAGEAAAEFIAGDSAMALQAFEEDVRDQFEGTINRALQRRAFLNRCWRTPAAQDDATMRRGWIAFEEYFAV